MSEELSSWADRLETALESADTGRFNRVRVVAETASTQDAALAASGRDPGLVLITGHQTGGRGRLGRVWSDDHGHGVAMTFVLDLDDLDSVLPLRAGLAACIACERARGGPCAMRWPNDVVEEGGNGRKLAGVLVEVREGLALVGIGINVLQRADDWAVNLKGRAVSLAELGSDCTRIETACMLLAAFEDTLRVSPDSVVEAWRRRDRLIGTRCALRVGDRRVVGRVLGIDPAGELTLMLDDGRTERIPAAQVSIENGPSGGDPFRRG